MSVGSVIRNQLLQRAPRLEQRVVRANWRMRNRDRSFSSAELEPARRVLADRLRRDGLVVTDFDSLFGDRELFERAEAQAQRLYAEPGERGGASGKDFLTKLARSPYRADDPFARIAVHPNVLAVANSYLRLRSTLRSLELWLTAPTPGPAVETQLWHRDGDDVMNVKLFLYFSDVTRAAGPLCYAPGTHPLGSRRELPERDERARSTDEQLARVVPESEWILCEGKPGTAVLADTCGYHKQLKPEGDERLLLVSHYVSGTPYAAHELELQGVDPGELTDDQHVAVFDRPRG